MAGPGKRIQKGEVRNPVGRPKGSTNKYGKIREQFFCALKELGGRDFIIKVAKDEPVAFLKIMSTLLPKQVEADVNVHSHEESIEDLE